MPVFDESTDFGQSVALPRRELKYPAQVEHWLIEWGEKLKASGTMIRIGSGALLRHAAQRGIESPLTENSTDVDPITQDDEVAELCYDAQIGSPFEQEKGWHINLMPPGALDGLPADWRSRSVVKGYGYYQWKSRADWPFDAEAQARRSERLAHQQWAMYNGLTTA